MPLQTKMRFERFWAKIAAHMPILHAQKIIMTRLCVKEYKNNGNRQQKQQQQHTWAVSFSSLQQMQTVL